jgi:hypothetical protein
LQRGDLALNDNRFSEHNLSKWQKETSLQNMLPKLKSEFKCDQKNSKYFFPENCPILFRKRKVNNIL